MRHRASMVAGSKSVLVDTITGNDFTLRDGRIAKIFVTDWSIEHAGIILKSTYVPGFRNPGNRRRLRLPKGVLRAAYLYLLQLINDGRIQEPLKPGQIFKNIDEPKPYELVPDLESVIKSAKSAEN